MLVKFDGPKAAQRARAWPGHRSRHRAGCPSEASRASPQASLAQTSSHAHLPARPGEMPSAMPWPPGTHRLPPSVGGRVTRASRSGTCANSSGHGARGGPRRATEPPSRRRRKCRRTLVLRPMPRSEARGRPRPPVQPEPRPSLGGSTARPPASPVEVHQHPRVNVVALFPSMEYAVCFSTVPCRCSEEITGWLAWLCSR